MEEFSRIYELFCLYDEEPLAVFKTDGYLIEIISDDTDGGLEQMCKGDFMRLSTIVEKSSHFSLSEITKDSEESNYKK